VSAPERPSLGAAYAATRHRTGAWQRLKRHGQDWLRAPGDASRAEALRADLAELERVESYWAYPGRRVVAHLAAQLADGDAPAFSRLTNLVVRMLVSSAYRVFSEDSEEAAETPAEAHGAYPELVLDERPYFEVLIVDDLPPKEEDRLRDRLLEFRRDDDPFVYDIVVVPSFEDAIIAVLLNYQIQSVVIRYGFPVASRHSLGIAERALARVSAGGLDGDQVGPALGLALADLRPELDLFLVSDASVEEIAAEHRRTFRRIFFRQEDLRELHLSITRGVQARYTTPFFSALRSYSQRPTGVFHALPIARGKSVSRSHWIRDLEDLFGSTLFMAETSATTGGLDSLLQPHGSLREAQALAARAFGARQSFFVTNGTSTANKIVLQAVTKPGDIVLATRDCHTSHHYAFVLSGAEPLYMDPYPIRQHGFYGGVPLATIRRNLLELREQGQLHRARVLLLTNCTFDGIVYNPLRVMEEVLAIQPEMTFIWDEAWFAFAAFTPITRRRTAMHAASTLRKRLRSAGYRARYATWKAAFDAAPAEERWSGPLMADPDTPVRVYATQSTHKTLTSLRQGSMIHVSDDGFAAEASEPFHQAYLTHTSSSANYPILASLDMGRRQVELEGYEMVQHAIELALVLRERVNSDPELGRHFRILTPEDLVPEEHRPSGFTHYQVSGTDWSAMDRAWEEDEFCLDPTRITLGIGATGIDGDAFKTLLIDRHDIQVNKTSPNSVLLMTHIGTTRGALAHLIAALASISDELDGEHAGQSAHRATLRAKAAARLGGELPELPNFSSFHPAFGDSGGGLTRAGNIRAAFFAAMRDDAVRYLRLDGEVQAALDRGEAVVSAAFITPYPPGFPVLVPGQVVSRGIVRFLESVSQPEIHGYDAALGLRLFTIEELSR
jgi:arginine decarboxylase